MDVTSWIQQSKYSEMGSTFRQYKNMKRKKYSFKISLPRPILLGMGKII